MECEECEGKGWIEGGCGMCNETGEGPADGTTCQACKGTGSDKYECEACNGTGVIEEDE